MTSRVSANLVDALMVVRLGGVHLLARRARRHRVGLQAHVVVGAVEAPRDAAVVLVADLVGQVLLERSSEGDVQELHAAADPEHGHVALHRAAREGDLDPVALGHR